MGISLHSNDGMDGLGVENRGRPQAMPYDAWRLFAQYGHRGESSGDGQGWKGIVRKSSDPTRGSANSGGRSRRMTAQLNVRGPS